MTKPLTDRPRLLAHVGELAAGYSARSDRWWIEPAAIGVGLVIFIIYSTGAAFAGDNFAYNPYISPFYSPLFRIPGVGVSPALFILWIPLGFRVTCYYYRKAYYRAFFWSPPACAVSDPIRDYRGEAGVLRWLPRLHRWFLYLSIIVLAVLWYDSLAAFDFDGRFGVGLGSLILLVNVVLLSFFTFGCHSLRSAVGGNQRCICCSAGGEIRYRSWRIVSLLNSWHPFFAWVSLYSVAAADLYVRLLSMGVLHDPRILL